MAKFYRRKFSKAPRDKYSVEQTSMNINITASQQVAVPVVAASNTQGMRKVKHLTISVSNIAPGVDINSTAYWALVYVPQGLNPNPLSVGTQTAPASLYEPNQFVLACGVFDLSAGPTRVSSPVSRNLNSGDTIYLIMANVSSTDNLALAAVVRYAVTLQ